MSLSGGTIVRAVTPRWYRVEPASRAIVPRSKGQRQNERAPAREVIDRAPRGLSATGSPAMRIQNVRFVAIGWEHLLPHSFDALAILLLDGRKLGLG